MYNAQLKRKMVGAQYFRIANARNVTFNKRGQKLTRIFLQVTEKSIIKVSLWSAIIHYVKSYSALKLPEVSYTEDTSPPLNSNTAL